MFEIVKTLDHCNTFDANRQSRKIQSRWLMWPPNFLCLFFSSVAQCQLAPQIRIGWPHTVQLQISRVYGISVVGKLISDVECVDWAWERLHGLRRTWSAKTTRIFLYTFCNKSRLTALFEYDSTNRIYTTRRES